jgi:adenosine deaminase
VSALVEHIASLPKAELHIHLDGSLRPATMLELAREEGISLPASTPEELASYMVVRDVPDLEGYLARYRFSLSVMQSAAALERIAEEFVHDVSREGVTYVEARWCPELHTRRGLTRADAVQAVLRGLERGESATGVTARTIIASLRTFDPSTSLELAELASDFVGQGVVAFDLAGSERDHPPGPHRAAFERARAAGLHLTVHAGEAAGPDSIRDAIRLCGAERLGHGTRLGDDQALADEVRRAQVPLEVCITSNVQTHAVPSPEAHPVTGYLRAGVPVTLSTDSRLMGGITLVSEYVLALERLGWSEAELASVAVAGFRAAFLPDEQREALVRQAEEAWGGVT